MAHKLWLVRLLNIKYLALHDGIYIIRNIVLVNNQNQSMYIIENINNS
jgi:hypothetical protein